MWNRWTSWRDKHLDVSGFILNVLLLWLWCCSASHWAHTCYDVVFCLTCGVGGLQGWSVLQRAAHFVWPCAFLFRNIPDSLVSVLWWTGHHTPATTIIVQLTGAFSSFWSVGCSAGLVKCFYVWFRKKIQSNDWCIDPSFFQTTNQTVPYGTVMGAHIMCVKS